MNYELFGVYFLKNPKNVIFDVLLRFNLVYIFLLENCFYATVLQLRKCHVPALVPESNSAKFTTLF